MKYISLIFTLSMLISFSGFAQTGGLKGPAAKNYKPWKDPKPPKAITVSVRKDIKGPEAKNQRPQQSVEKTLVADTNTFRKGLKGPEAKNYKPWKE